MKPPQQRQLPPQLMLVMALALALSPGNNDDVDDDIWSDDDTKLIPQNDIIRSHYKKGYVDGITQAKESSLQQGFDDGYPEGAKLGLKLVKF